jgi:hypothetical protein
MTNGKEPVCKELMAMSTAVFKVIVLYLTFGFIFFFLFFFLFNSGKGKGKITIDRK